MSQTTIQHDLTLVTTTCCSCGVVFAVPSVFERNRREDHGTFYCPSGHSLHYPGKTPTEKRVEELERQKRDLENSVTYWKNEEATERKKATAAKGQVTRLKNRAAKGVCPCCNRTFQNLARHMNGQHPDFATPQETQDGGR